MVFITATESSLRHHSSVLCLLRWLTSMEEFHTGFICLKIISNIRSCYNRVEGMSSGLIPVSQYLGSMNPRHLQMWQSASATMPSLPAAMLSPPWWTVPGTGSSNKPAPLKLLLSECFIETTGKESKTVFVHSHIFFQTISHLHYLN